MIRIGVIGCGRIVNAHLQGFRVLRERGLGEFRITAFAARPGKIDDARQFCRRGWVAPRTFHPPRGPRSVDPLLAPYTPVSDFQDDIEARPYEDYRRMLADDVCDAVLDTTSVFAHHQVTCDALEAGKHVLVQKPMAISVKAARRMCERAEANGRVLAVVEVARYADKTRAQKWAFESGLLGEPQLGFVGAVGGRWSPDRICADTPWRHLKLQAGGGPAIDLGPHFFDEMRYLFGEVIEVTGVTCMVETRRHRRDERGGIVESVEPDVDDTFTAVVRFASGARATIFWSWGGHGEGTGIAGGPVYYGSRGSIKGGTLALDDGTRGDLIERFRAEADPAMLDRWFPSGGQDAFALNQYDWLRAIAEPGHTCETDGREGLMDLAASFAILESSHARRTVTFEEVLSGQLDASQRPINEHYGL